MVALVIKEIMLIKLNISSYDWIRYMAGVCYERKSVSSGIPSPRGRVTECVTECVTTRERVSEVLSLLPGVVARRPTLGPLLQPCLDTKSTTGCRVGGAGRGEMLPPE